MNQRVTFLSNPEFVRWVKSPDAELDAFWQNWMMAHPEDIAEIMLARELLLGLSSKSNPVKSGTKEELLLKILQGKQPIPKRDKPNRNLPFWFRIDQFRRIAAILAFGFLTAQLAGWLVKKPEIDEVNEPEIVWITKTTNAGEKLKLGLPDQSEVWLNSSSTLSYPESFGQVDRRVKLTGEAFFKVESDSLRAFYVETSNLITKVLGTSFNVKEDKGGTTTKVALETGSIQVNARGDSSDAVLWPGQEMMYDATTTKKVIRTFDPKNTSGWTDGWLVFDNNHLSEVIGRLEDWYGVTISIEGSPSRTWNFSGEFRHETLQNILESIAYTESFTFRIDNKKVTIKF
ncbi:FecR family protein [Lunatimonas lonarensis]|nr:FecR family protein [Lunatimonas lonarensis]